MRVLIVLALIVDALLAYRLITYDASRTLNKEQIRAKTLHRKLMEVY